MRSCYVPLDRFWFSVYGPNNILCLLKLCTYGLLYRYCNQLLEFLNDFQWSPIQCFCVHFIMVCDYTICYGAINPYTFSYLTFFCCCVCVLVQYNIAVTHHLGNKARLLLFYTSACCLSQSNRLSDCYIPPWRLLSRILVSGHTLTEGITLICGVAIIGSKNAQWCQ